MTNISMYRISRVYTEKVDEFKILRYTIPSSHTKIRMTNQKETKFRLKVVIKYGIIRTMEKYGI